MTTSIVEAEAPGTTEEEGRKFVTFFLGDGELGLPLESVQEIIRVPDLVKVPLTPPSLLGIANLRGEVLPVASLRKAFELDERDADDSMRVVVVNRGVPMGILVDRMSTVMTAEPSEIEDAQRLRDVVRNDLVEQVVQRSERRVLVFDAQRVLREALALPDRTDELHSAGLLSGAGGSPAGMRRGAETGSDAEERQLVSFEVGDQEYALAISRVKEIVNVPEYITTVPKAPSTVVGVMVLRQRMLPLVSLRRLLQLPEGASKPQRVVVTTGFGDSEMNIGLVVDTVREVLRLTDRQIDEVPSYLKRGNDELQSICRLEGGKRIVTVLEVSRLLDTKALEASLEDVELEDGTVLEEHHGGTAMTAEEEQFVIFKIDRDGYGIAIDAVQEIVRIPPEMTAVPKAPDFVEGVINLRGQVLPVIDQRKRLGLPATERHDRQRIMVLRVRNQLLGFIVDSVAEVRKVPVCRIGPAPSLSKAQEKLIRRVAQLGEERGIVMLLEPDQMVPEDAAPDLEEALRDLPR